MTETPSDGFPDPPSTDPSAPPIAPYGEPVEPPKKKKRRWLRVVLGLVVLIVVGVVVSAVVAGTRTRHHLSLKPTVAGLARTEPVEAQAQSYLETLNGVWNSSVTNNISAEYGTGDDAVLVSAVEIKTRFADPDATAKNFGKALNAAGTFAKVGGKGDLVVECAAGSDSTPTTCFWTDRDTAGITVSLQLPDKAGPLTTSIAQDLEAK